MAKEYGVLPTVAAAALDDDPGGLIITSLAMLRYSEAKHAFDTAKDKVKDLKGWRDNPAMDAVTKNTFELRQERQEG